MLLKSIRAKSKNYINHCGRNQKNGPGHGTIPKFGDKLKFYDCSIVAFGAIVKSVWTPHSSSAAAFGSPEALLLLFNFYSFWNNLWPEVNNFLASIYSSLPIYFLKSLMMLGIFRKVLINLVWWLRHWIGLLLWIKSLRDLNTRLFLRYKSVYLLYLLEFNSLLKKSMKIMYFWCSWSLHKPTDFYLL